MALGQFLGITDPHRPNLHHLRGAVRPERPWLLFGQRPDNGFVGWDLGPGDGAGPSGHAVVVGMTGAGKTELLTSLVLAGALTHSSGTVNFVLVDRYRNNRWRQLSRLPHTAGVADTLGEEAAAPQRLVDSLLGELERRHRCLQSYGFRTVREYDAARRTGAALASLPRLAVVWEEYEGFAITEPHAVQQLATVAAYGGALGVHLLLSMQRYEERLLPGATVHGWTRIGLRTRSDQESRAVLGVPDLYELDRTPGRGLVWSTDGSLQWFAAPTVSRRDDLENPDAEFEALVEALADTDPPSYELVLPPLDRDIRLDEPGGPVTVRSGRGLGFTDPCFGGSVRVPVGMIDLPRLHRQEALWFDTDPAAGPFAVVGAPKSGRSTALRTIVTGIALTRTPVETEVYCLDLDGGGLAPLAALPHVRDLADGSDRKGVWRVVDTVGRLLAVRSAADDRAEAAGRPFFSDQSAAGAVCPVHLVVDGWDRLPEDVRPAVEGLVVRGRQHGIQVLVAGRQWDDLPAPVRDALTVWWELWLGFPERSRLPRAAAKGLFDVPPGRGLTMAGQHFRTALPQLTDTTEAELVERIALAAPPTESDSGQLQPRWGQRARPTR